MYAIFQKFESLTFDNIYGGKTLTGALMLIIYFTSIVTDHYRRMFHFVSTTLSSMLRIFFTLKPVILANKTQRPNKAQQKPVMCREQEAGFNVTL